jgi:hypothetical protein
MEWTEWAKWFSYGRFERSGILKGRGWIWIFDKPRIEHELSANLHRFRFCPFLRMRLIRAVLAALPDKVEITEGCGWQYSRSYGEVPGSIKMKDVSKTDGFEFESEFYADGVRPQGLREVERLLQRAFAEASVTDVDASSLVK